MTRKILSITGNKPMNYVLRTSFSKNYNVLLANDISSGISLLKSTKNVKLFIIDADYQTQENIEFIKFISNSRSYSKPVIVLSSNSELMEGLDSKTVPYCFLKPFNPIDLVAAADKLLEQ